jgi:tetratricopeptide (TPR) repeat protein
MRTMVFQSLLVAQLGECLLLAGRLGDALQVAERALSLSVTYKERGHQGWALRVLGEIAASGDPPHLQEAEAYYRQALTLAEELGMRPLEAHCQLGLGRFYGQVGRPEQARVQLSAAVELLRSMEMTFWLPDAEAELAKVPG